jgi:hypothetical protein
MIGSKDLVKVPELGGMIESVSVFHGKLFALEGAHRGFLATDVLFLMTNQTQVDIGLVIYKYLNGLFVLKVLKNKEE